MQNKTLQNNNKTFIFYIYFFSNRGASRPTELRVAPVLCRSFASLLRFVLWRLDLWSVRRTKHTSFVFFQEETILFGFFIGYFFENHCVEAKANNPTTKNINPNEPSSELISPNLSLPYPL